MYYIKHHDNCGETVLSILYTLASIGLIVIGIWMIFAGRKPSSKPEVPVGTFRIVKDRNAEVYFLEVYRLWPAGHPSAPYSWEQYDTKVYDTPTSAMDAAHKYKSKCCAWSKILSTPDYKKPIEYIPVWIEA